MRSRNQLTEDTSKWPIGGGGNFVDATLRVVVKQAVGTMMAFMPQYMHGTTRLCGAHNWGCAITFSKHIKDAYDVAVAGTKVEAGEGAGEGNTD